MYINIRLVSTATMMCSMNSRTHQFYSQYVSITMSYWTKWQQAFAIKFYFQTGEPIIHNQAAHNVIMFGIREFGSMENGNTAGTLLHGSLIHGWYGGKH